MEKEAVISLTFPTTWRDCCFPALGFSSVISSGYASVPSDVSVFHVGVIVSATLWSEAALSICKTGAKLFTGTRSNLAPH